MKKLIWYTWWGRDYFEQSIRGEAYEYPTKKEAIMEMKTAKSNVPKGKFVLLKMTAEEIVEDQ